MFIITDKNRIISSTGKVIYYHTDEFVDEIVKSENCFICGASSVDKKFNDEHVIPNWILKRHSLHNASITLPTGELKKYSRYKISCCEDCNYHLGKVYEEPVSKILTTKYSDLRPNLNKENIHLIYRWLCLIFVKTHLRGKSVRLEKNLKIDSFSLSDVYDWRPIHHLYCLARSSYSNPIISEEVYGTILFVKMADFDIDFDYIDSHSARVSAIKLGDYMIIAVLDDSGFSGIVYEDILKKVVKNKLSHVQVREIIANLAAINLSIEKRPKFTSGINNKGQYNISVNRPKVIKFYNDDKKRFTPGPFLKYYLQNLPDLTLTKQEFEQIERSEFTFLIDKEGNFINHMPDL